MWAACFFLSLFFSFFFLSLFFSFYFIKIIFISPIFFPFFLIPSSTFTPSSHRRFPYCSFRISLTLYIFSSVFFFFFFLVFLQSLAFSSFSIPSLSFSVYCSSSSSSSYFFLFFQTSCCIISSKLYMQVA